MYGKCQQTFRGRKQLDFDGGRSDFRWPLGYDSEQPPHPRATYHDIYQEHLCQSRCLDAYRDSNLCAFPPGGETQKVQRRTPLGQFVHDARFLVEAGSGLRLAPQRWSAPRSCRRRRDCLLVVGWPAGGPSDSVARLVSAQMSKTLGQSIVIDNRAGAGGNIGSDIAARAKPDGSTIMLATATSHGLNSALYSRLNYDPIKDFAPIGLITTSPGVMLVPKDSPYHSVAELVAKARAQPGQLNYGSGGVGSSQHLAGAVFRKLANVDVAHIPFKGTAPAMTDLMAGESTSSSRLVPCPLPAPARSVHLPWPRINACLRCLTSRRLRKSV